MGVNVAAPPAGQPRQLRGMAGAVRCAIFSVLLSGLLIAVSAAALFVTSAPRWISLMVEPFSLLLAPGVLTGLLLSHKHDYAHAAILRVDFCFYFLLLFAALWAREKRRAATGRSGVYGGSGFHRGSR